MKLQEGDIINLADNKLDYLVLKTLDYEGIHYVWLITTKRPAEMCMARVIFDDNGKEILKSVTDKQEFETIFKAMDLSKE